MLCQSSKESGWFGEREDRGAKREDETMRKEYDDAGWAWYAITGGALPVLTVHLSRYCKAHVRWPQHAQPLWHQLPSLIQSHEMPDQQSCSAGVDWPSWAVRCILRGLVAICKWAISYRGCLVDWAASSSASWALRQPDGQWGCLPNCAVQQCL
ncbi:hypothetical protein BD289DRAFT_192285 [Coniella lustricola]|uniref:Uncharacterized protein n=1 Tax=Coniella lustricola TaxID=2025994 RepID=A0A2T3ALU5_9PEZI|nr:hypothetical protein BD289DRAFT_192285 [Coniella lustricola]